jgi:DNA-binding MarR family transcriptional regulator
VGQATEVVRLVVSKISDKRLVDLVEAFTDMGPAWARWVQACLPEETVSFPRLRVLTTLQCDGEKTMKQIAEALGVTARRITSLVDALEADGLIERYAHPTDGRSIVVAITETGLKQQRLASKQMEEQVSVAFGDLTATEQEQLLDISHKMTDAFKGHLAALQAPKPISREARKLPARRSRTT